MTASNRRSVLEALADECDRYAELEATAAEMASLIRFLRPDLSHTRLRADRVLTRYEEWHTSRVENPRKET